MSTEFSDTITVQDRFGLTLFFAVVLHAVLLLGIGFDVWNTKSSPLPPTLEITLVTQSSEKPPEKPDFLAQANQTGGGNVEDKTPPPAPPPGKVTTPPDTTLAPAAQPAPEPVAEVQPTPEPPPPEPAKQKPVEPPKPKSEPAKPNKPVEKKVLTQAKSEQKIATLTEPAANTAAPLPSAEQLINRGMEIASLSAQINESVKAYAQRPKQKFISARTQEYKYAAYMEAWRVKVESIGNLNYPDEARRNNLSGSLMLDVALNPDGSVKEITLSHSSGEKVLDDAAVRIVQLASPFAPFPDDIRSEVDILHITRTWQFLRDNHLSSK